LTPQLRRRAKKKPRREPGLEHGHAAEITVDSGCWCCSVAVSAPIKSPRATRQVSEDMPLRCLGPDGQSIHSFDLTEADWSALRLENRRSRQLQMPWRRRDHENIPSGAGLLRPQIARPLPECARNRSTSGAQGAGSTGRTESGMDMLDRSKRLVNIWRKMDR